MPYILFKNLKVKHILCKEKDTVQNCYSIGGGEQQDLNLKINFYEVQ